MEYPEDGDSFADWFRQGADHRFETGLGEFAEPDKEVRGHQPDKIPDMAVAEGK